MNPVSGLPDAHGKSLGAQVAALPDIAVRARRAARAAKFRRFAKSYIWSLATFSVLYLVAVLILFVPATALSQYAPYDAEGRSLIVAAVNAALLGPLIVLLLMYVFLPFVIVLYISLLIISRRQQVLLAKDLHEEIEARHAARLFVYLRSFDLDRSTVMSRFGATLKAYLVAPFAIVLMVAAPTLLSGLGQGYAICIALRWFASIRPISVEEELADCIGDRGMFIAIGNRGESHGAIKLIAGDDEWEAVFRELVTRCAIVFHNPGFSDHVIWEAQYIVGDQALRQKTFWIMPNVSQAQWDMIRVEYERLVGIRLPEYRPRGGFFRILSDFSFSMIVAPRAFMTEFGRSLTRSGGARMKSAATLETARALQSALTRAQPT